MRQSKCNFHFLSNLFIVLHFLTIEIVNCIKAGSLNSRLFKLLCQDMESEHVALLFHTNVRWLSKGNMLKRLHQLKEEVAIFLESRKKRNLLEKFQSQSFQQSLAYLVEQNRTEQNRFILSHYKQHDLHIINI